MKKLWGITAMLLVLAMLLAGCSGLSLTGPEKPAQNQNMEKAEALVEEGLELLKEEEYEEALYAFEDALDLQPGLESAYLGMADAYEGLGEMQNAIDVLEECLDEGGGSRVRRRLERLQQAMSGGAQRSSTAQGGSAGQGSSSTEQPPSSSETETFDPDKENAEAKARHENAMTDDIVRADNYLPYPAHAVTSANLNLRNGPGTEYDSLVLMPVGSMVEEVGWLNYTSEWVLILYGGEYGWAATEYLAYEGGMAKPVIYLYPEQETDVAVQVHFAHGGFTCTYPDYGEGWQVTAQPDGMLTNHADGREYSYLYWEGEGRAVWDMSEGYVVAGADTAAFLQKTLAKMGLTPREYNEFIVYWLPLMQRNAYNFITFQASVYTEAVQLEVTPRPDSVLRVFMVFQPLESWQAVPAPAIAPFVRQGFAVVEWGGTQLGSGSW